MKIPRWVKACVGIGLLAALVSQLDWSRLVADVEKLDWWLVAAATLSYPAALLIGAARWSAALRLHDLSFTYVYLLRITSIGWFVNNFLPSAIGGDIYRVYRTSGGDSTSQAVSAVLCERTVGFAAMLVLGLVGALWLAESSELAQLYLVWSLGGLAAALALALVGALTHRRLASVLELSPRLRPISLNLKRIARPHPAWLELVAYSIVYQLLSAAAAYFAFLAVGAAFSVAGALLAAVAAGIAAVVPISISGIGVVEGSIVGAGVALGVGYDEAFLAAIVVRMLTFTANLACGIVYFFDAGRAANPAMLSVPSETPPT